MRREMIAALLAIIIVASAGIGFLVGSTNSHNITETQTSPRTLSDCGFSVSCTASNPSGLIFALSINSTHVKSNGSFNFVVTLVNPTNHTITLPNSNEWYLPSLRDTIPCWGGTIPWGFSVYRGYYTAANVSSATDVLYPDVYPACITPPKVSSFSVPALSARGPIRQTIASSIYAIDVDYVTNGATNIIVLSLRSSTPSVYTMVAGDVWGDFVILHFSVVTA